MSLHEQGQAVDNTLSHLHWLRTGRQDVPDLRDMDPYDYGAVGYQAHVKWALAYIRRTYGLPTTPTSEWFLVTTEGMEARHSPEQHEDWCHCGMWPDLPAHKVGAHLEIPKEDQWWATDAVADATARRVLESHLHTQTTRLRTVVNPGVHTLTTEDIEQHRPR